MSFANGTIHYNLPQTVGTDKRDWFDTNTSFAAIDAAIYGAVETATETASAITALTTRVGSAEADIATIQTSLGTDESKISALELLTSQHSTQIADVKADALDMICAVDEGTAQVATVAVSEGDYFRYNDVLYIATDDIAIGDTIVPNTNCRATNVATELEGVNSLAADVAELKANKLLHTRVAVSTSTAVSGITPFGYKGQSLPVGGSADVQVVGYTVEAPSSGDWVFSVEFNTTTNVVVVYANGTATVYVDLTYYIVE